MEGRANNAEGNNPACERGIGIKRRELRRAAKQLGVRKERKGYKGEGYGDPV